MASLFIKYAKVNHVRQKFNIAKISHCSKRIHNLMSRWYPTIGFSGTNPPPLPPVKSVRLNTYKCIFKIRHIEAPTIMQQSTQSSTQASYIVGHLSPWIAKVYSEVWNHNFFLISQEKVYNFIPHYILPLPDRMVER